MTRNVGNRNIHRAAIIVGLASIVFVAACIPSSFLVTPVSSNRGLVETELSRDAFFASDKIAVIDVDGTLLNAAAPGLFSEGEHTVSLLVEKLTKARKDPRVKGRAEPQGHSLPDSSDRGFPF